MSVTRRIFSAVSASGARAAGSGVDRGDSNERTTVTLRSTPGSGLGPPCAVRTGALPSVRGVVVRDGRLDRPSAPALVVDCVVVGRAQRCQVAGSAEAPPRSLVGLVVRGAFRTMLDAWEIGRCAGGADGRGGMVAVGEALAGSSSACWCGLPLGRSGCCAGDRGCRRSGRCRSGCRTGSSPAGRRRPVRSLMVAGVVGGHRVVVGVPAGRGPGGLPACRIGGAVELAFRTSRRRRCADPGRTAAGGWCWLSLRVAAGQLGRRAW